MKRLLFVPLALIILFYGCKKENTTAPVTTLSGSGALMMKIDRQNAPAGVETVTASLFRPGSDTLTNSVNIITDSVAVLAFEAVPVGAWQLRVEAKANNGTVLYRGESGLEVIANQTTNVNLTLVPVTGSTGSVVINVTWGTLPPGWVDNLTNPVLIPAYSQYDFDGVLQPVVYYDGTKYRMWYAGLVNSARSYIMYAESNDGKTWLKKNNGLPVLYPTDSGWDNWGVSPGAVIYDNGVYKMYYFGAQGTYSNWQIGLAVSTDGISWERHSPHPVLVANSNEPQVIATSLVKMNNTYMLYYTSRNYPYYTINVATSSDGINFQRYPGNPVLAATHTWEGSGIHEASVIYENGQFKMVYSNSVDPQSGFGFAFSQDGLTWQKAAGNPFFRNTNTASNWASGSAAYPCYIKTPTEYRVYYSGFNAQSSVYRIGYVKKPL